jgi:hypothetical protein
MLDDAIFKACPGCTSKSLVCIESAEYVSLYSTNSSIIDGSSLEVIGIELTNSRYCHLIGIQVRNCLDAGIIVQEGALLLNHMNSISACFIQNCKRSIVGSILSSLMIVGNEISGSDLVGILVESKLTSVIVGNIFTENSTDMQVHSQGSVILSNIFSGGSNCNIELSDLAANTLVCDNTFALPFCQFSDTIRLSGCKNIFLNNRFADNVNISVSQSVSMNCILCQQNLLSYQIQMNLARRPDASDVQSSPSAVDSLDTNAMLLFYPVKLSELHSTNVSTNGNASSIRIDISVIGSPDYENPSDISIISEVSLFTITHDVVLLKLSKFSIAINLLNNLDWRISL